MCDLYLVPAIDFRTRWYYRIQDTAGYGLRVAGTSSEGEPLDFVESGKILIRG